MEETDPAHVVREKKHIVGTDAPGPMPMVPPMGMPMSPHMAGQPAQPVQPFDAESTPLLADAQFRPAQPFGGEPGLPHAFTEVESSALTPMEPATFTPMEPAAFTPMLPATPAMPVTPAVQGIPALPATQAVPPTQLSQGLVQEGKILPAVVEPGERLAVADHDGCCCCGESHDGQENRPFSRDDAVHATPDQGTPTGEPRQLTHENMPAAQQTPRGEVTKPVPTEEAPDSNTCCACCGDKHPGLENSPNDSLTTPGTVTEPDEEDESGDDVAKDDDCPPDDEKPGKEDGSTQTGDDNEKPNEPAHAGDNGKDGDKGKDDGNGKDDGKDDDCPHYDSTPEDPGELPATQPVTSGDVPLSPKTLPAPVENLPASQTTPLSPVESTPRTAVQAPQNAAAQPESAYRLEPMQPTQRQLLEPKPATPAQPTQAGILNQRPLSRVEAPKNTPAQRLTPATSTGTPAFRTSSPETLAPRQYNALAPAVPGSPTEGTRLDPGGDQGVPDKNAPVTEGTTTNPEGAYRTVPGPGATQEQPVKPVTSTSPAYTSGNPLHTSGLTFPGVNGQGSGVPQDGNVGPDPNVKFDEASYNQLSAVIGGMKSTLDDAYKIDVVYLDDELLLQPYDQKWAPAQKLVKRGGLFGGSVKRESDALEKTLSTFHQALEQAKAVFKETNDLAAYDATKFTTEYPGFTSGPGVV